MFKTSLRTKIQVSVGLIILVVLGVSTVVQIRYVRQDYIGAIKWGSGAVAQSILKSIQNYTGFYYEDQFKEEKLDGVAGSLGPECMTLYEINKDQGITHVGVINVDNVMVAHNERDRWDTPIESPVLLEQLKDLQSMNVVFDGDIYHALIPIIGGEKFYLGAVDIGISSEVLDGKIRQMIFRSLVLLALFLVLANFSIAVLMRIIVTKPVKQLVEVGQQLAEGHLLQTTRIKTTGQDEITLINTVFKRISAYMQNVAIIASRIATGMIDSEIQVRSARDVLGNAVHNMLQYLNHVATVANNIAEGDLTAHIQLRSDDDTFGRSIQAMLEGLHSLIIQIRTSTEQIASTGETIKTLSAEDIDIVQKVQSSAGDVVTTVNEMGASIEEVDANMDTLSSAVEETFASVSQVTASIAQIASNSKSLTEQTQQTIEALNNEMVSLEKVVESTDASKQLSQDTIQSAMTGQQSVEDVTHSMEALEDTINTAVESITGFAKRSRDIGTILDVIGEITEQTSLLALNASIIAAQAGTHGRGFAVVADEIKNLADGVRTSTKDIDAIVQTLQRDTQSVVQTIHEGAAKVKEGMGRTHEARESLQQILTSAQRSSAVVTEIADALHGLRISSRNVVKAMEQVNMMTDEITRATNEHKANTMHINKAMEHINQMTAQVRKATIEQTNGIQQVLEAMREVTDLIEHNLISSRHIGTTTEELTSQSNLLLASVDRFKLTS